MWRIALYTHLRGAPDLSSEFRQLAYNNLQQAESLEKFPQGCGRLSWPPTGNVRILIRLFKLLTFHSETDKNEFMS